MSEVIGIIGAMESEVSSLCAKIQDAKKTVFGALTFYSGVLCGKNVVVVKSGVGKVNAALCAQSLIVRFGVTKVINTGIAGATGAGLSVFDFVVSSSAVYHDVDVTIFGYAVGQLPQMEREFSADEKMADAVVKAFSKTKAAGEHKIIKGVIASGDQFISSGERKDFIKRTFNPACVEMEGCAIAHACTLNNVPFVIVRCMSDMADDTAEKTYDFNEDTAAAASADLILEFLALE